MRWPKDGKEKLQEIAAKNLGGKPEDYEVANERVFRKGGGAGMTLAQAAQKAIELGGTYDGHEPPEDVNKFTKTSMLALAGQGLLVAARDKYPHDGQTHSFVASFAEVEVDVETGKYHIVDFLAVADVGTVIHPRALGGQVLGRSMLGHRSRDRAEVGLRSALRSAARQALLQQQTADDSRCSGQHAVGRAGYPGSGNAGGRARYRRASGRRRLRRDFECAFGRPRRRGFPPRSGDCPTRFWLRSKPANPCRMACTAHI